MKNLIYSISILKMEYGNKYNTDCTKQYKFNPVRINKRSSKYSCNKVFYNFNSFDIHNFKWINSNIHRSFSKRKYKPKINKLLLDNIHTIPIRGINNSWHLGRADNSFLHRQVDMVSEINNGN